jgi:hypothetical protein
LGEYGDRNSGIVYNTVRQSHREWREILVFMGKPKGWTLWVLSINSGFRHSVGVQQTRTFVQLNFDSTDPFNSTQLNSTRLDFDSTDPFNSTQLNVSELLLQLQSPLLTQEACLQQHPGHPGKPCYRAASAVVANRIAMTSADSRSLPATQRATVFLYFLRL